MDKITVSVDELAQVMARAIAQQSGVVLKDSLPSQTFGNIHGTSGLFYGPYEKRIWNANPMPQMGFASKLRTYPGLSDSPLHAILLDQAANQGSHPAANNCGPCKVPGALSKGVVSFVWGKQCLSTPTMNLTRTDIGGLKNRGDFRDFRVIGTPASGNGTTPTLPGTAGLANSEYQTAMAQFLNGWVMEYGRLVFTGNPANNSGDYKEFKGLDILINTGYTDAETAGAIAAADSIVDSFSGTLGTPADLSGTIVTKITNLYRRLKSRARLRGLNAQWDIVLTERFFYELTALWPCTYITARCTPTTGTANNITSVNVDARDQVAMRDAMREGQYLLIDGAQVPVTLDEAIVETALTAGDAGKYTTQIYFVPRVVNGIDATYLEFFDYSNPNTTQLMSEMAHNNGMFVSDGGQFIWTRRQDGFCVSLQAVESHRLVLETPFLAGREVDIKYTPSVVTESGF